MVFKPKYDLASVEHQHLSSHLHWRQRRQHFLLTCAERVRGHRAFHGWAAAAATRRHHRHVLNSAAGRLRNRAAASAFNTWSSLVLYRHWKHDMAATAAQRLAGLRKSLALGKWQRACAGGRLKRERLAGAVAAMQHHVQVSPLSSAFQQQGP